MVEETKQLSVYDLIAMKVQAYFPHAKVKHEGSSIIYDNAIYYTIRFEVNEPFTAGLLKVLKDKIHEHDFVLVDFDVYCENGKPAIDFWITPKVKINPVKVTEP